MGGDTPVYNEKNILEVPPPTPPYFPFMAYLLDSNYEKSAECSPTFRWGKSFSNLPKYWQASKYTVLLNKFSFPKKGKNKSNFRMVNLCNGGSKDFAELWEVIDLKIWTHFSIRQTKLFLS